MEKNKSIEEAVQALKLWYSKQHHLPRNIDEHYFYNFVSGTNSLERAKQKIDAYFTLRKEVIDLFNSVKPGTKTFEEHCKSSGMAILPDKTPEGYRVIFATVWDFTDKYNYGAQMLRNYMLIEIGLNLWPTDTSYVLIQDLKFDSANSLRSLDLKHYKGLSKLLLKGHPIKLKKYYLFNAASYIDNFLSLVRTFLSKKLNERVVCYRDDAKLKEVLPIEMLPLEYGGKGQSLREMDAKWNKEISSRENWFRERSKLVTDESKRPKDAYLKESLDFGVEGSFKKLTID